MRRTLARKAADFKGADQRWRLIRAAIDRKGAVAGERVKGM